MRRLSMMSALSLAALADAPSVRTQIAAIREHEEKRASCRVLADIFRRPREEVEKMAADLDWDMHALQEQLSGQPKHWEKAVAKRAVLRGVAESAAILRRVEQRTIHA